MKASFGLGVLASSWSTLRQGFTLPQTQECSLLTSNGTTMFQQEQATTVFGCPVFKTSFKAGKGTCNPWPIDKLVPCQLGAVYHKKRENRLVILSRFASFLDTVPE